MPPTILDRTFFCELSLQIEELDQHLIVHPKTGMLMAMVPAGKFLTDTDGVPFEVDLPAYYVAVHPVTNAQYARFVNETEHPNAERSHPYSRSVWNNGTFPSGKADYPAVCVGWDDAAAYCLWAGLRLPTELEWEKAARGQDGRAFPWGQNWNPSRCRNTQNKGAETTANVWSYGHGGSPYGGLQLSGNVWEWCNDYYDDGAYTRYRQGDLTVPISGEFRLVRGGSWNRGGPRKPIERHYSWSSLNYSRGYGDPWTSEGRRSIEWEKELEKERVEREKELAIRDFSAGRRGRRRPDAHDDSCGFRCVDAVGASL